MNAVVPLALGVVLGVIACGYAAGCAWFGWTRTDVRAVVATALASWLLVLVAAVIALIQIPSAGAGV